MMMVSSQIHSHTFRTLAGAIVAGAALLGLTACGIGDTSPAGPSEGAKAAGFNADAPLADLVPKEFQKTGVLQVGTQPDFEPANFTPIGKTAIEGYNVDLMTAMADKLGLTVQWDKVPFDQLLIGMQSKKFDVAIAGMTDKKERQQQVDFLDYQYAGSVLMVLKGNPKGITGALDGSCGTKVGDVKGSDSVRKVDRMTAACVAAGKPPVELVSFPSASDKNLALTSGRIDSIFWPDMAVVTIMRETGDKLEAIPVEFDDKVFLGMTFNKEETQLRDAFVQALDAIHKDGTYDDVLKKWDVEVINLPTPGVNLAQK